MSRLREGEQCEHHIDFQVQILISFLSLFDERPAYRRDMKRAFSSPSAGMSLLRTLHAWMPCPNFLPHA